MRIRTTVVAMIAAWLLVACGAPGVPSPPGSTSIALRTQEPVGSETLPGCPTALIEGVLVVDEGSGVALRDDSGQVGDVIWPHGFSGRIGDPVAVVDADGKIVARVGDRVRIGGGEITGDGAWMACGGIEVL